MRIISGSLRGRRIPELKSVELRPTTDFAKEGLFNILNNLVTWKDALALDLFAGTGNISMEIISRGAKKVVAIEKNRAAVSFIEDLAKNFEVQEKIDAYNQDAIKYLDKASNINFNIIFADPPFDFPMETYNKIVGNIFENKWLANNGIFIVEHSKEKDFSDHSLFKETRKYGSVRFSFFQNEPIKY